MALVLGTRLTRELIEKIKHESNLHTNETLFLISVGDEGFPNVSLLSYLDISVVTAKRLIFAIGENSSSKRNLVKRGRGTLVFWLGKTQGLYYLKGSVILLKERLQSTVEDVNCSAFLMNAGVLSRDHSNKARLLSTVTYDPKETNSAHFELFNELKRISRTL